MNGGLVVFLLNPGEWRGGGLPGDPQFYLKYPGNPGQTVSLLFSRHIDLGVDL